MPRHDIGPLDDWRSSFANAQRRRQIILDRDPLPSDGPELLDCHVELLCLGALFDEHHSELASFAARGSGAAAAGVLCQSEADGSVLLTEHGLPMREIPVGPAGLNPAGWRDGLMLACIARDGDAQSIIIPPERVSACQLPADRQDAFWWPYGLALASLVSENDDFTRYADEALRLMDEASITAPGVLTQVDRPLLDLARALHRGNQSEWNEEVHRTLRAHRAYADAPEHHFDRRLFVAVGIVGLCAVALDRGLETYVQSDYIPVELVRGEHRAELSRVVFQFAPRRVIRDAEASWFLDLAGFDRTGRTHRVGEMNGRLVARHDASGAPGLPHARVDFVLSSSSGSDAPPPQALDAGQLLFLARRFATTAGDTQLTPEVRRAALAEAVESVQSVLDRIPADSESVPDATITSSLGLAELEAEPGRFRRDRLMAYRDSLAQQLASLSDAVATALVMAEVVAAQARPLLAALAHDRGGAVLAELAPRESDYDSVFAGEAVDVARRYYSELWRGRLDLQYPSAEQTSLLVSVAPAGMLSSENELSRQFPGGYRAIAAWLNPHRTWLRWKYVRPGETAGLAYDGLVWCDDHWAWFPKPYRALAPLAKP